MIISNLASASASAGLAADGRWRTVAAAAAVASPASAAAPADGVAPSTASASVSSDSSDSAAAAPTSAVAGDRLTAQEQQLLAQLVQTDRLVRAHEQAHLAAGAGLVRGGASFSYTTGPDDRRYAVGGEVSIDASSASTPQETIAKARQIRAAALAPAQPSAQDQSVAASAARMENEALLEIAAQQRTAAVEPESGAQRLGSEAIAFYRDVAGDVLGGGLDVFA